MGPIRLREYRRQAATCQSEMQKDSLRAQQSDLIESRDTICSKELFFIRMFLDTNGSVIYDIRVILRRRYVRRDDGHQDADVGIATIAVAKLLGFLPFCSIRQGERFDMILEQKTFFQKAHSDRY